MTIPDEYPAPLDGLNALGLDESERLATVDYRQLGINEKDIPALIRIATDRRFDTAMVPEAWAPVHAWRALGMLRAAEATGPLLALLDRVDEDDWILEEVPRALGEIGAPALAAAEKYLADPSRPHWGRVAASNALGLIGQKNPESRASCVDALTTQLQLFAHQDTELTAFLIGDLLNLHAVESAPVMEKAFRADRVALSLNGDWEDVQVELGLLPARLTPRPSYHRSFQPRGPAPSKPAATRDHQAEKRRRKLSKQSKRRNRRRK